ncbi:uncharacterized protein Dwil_GK14654 [Drosophila willistoni]|uniref:Vitellogenin domain-containing protein n=1 Tax=Drosophila willistoni TaxID=7260 RepID=B4MVA4_DROWI|nr:uncharacterized protein LOC6642867 [Drosophila willistoni]EDW76449.2 uncharacterized protein Dwil_GK14654 [Drosophila willistoni]
MGSFTSLATQWIVLVLLFGIGQAARENPLKDPRICGRPQCEPKTSKFNYGEVLYKYDYTVSVRTEFAGSGDNSSDLFLKANLDIFFPKPCEGYLRINDAKLFDKSEAFTADNSNFDSYNEKPKDVVDYYDTLSSAENSFSDQDTPVTEEYENLHPKSMDLANDLRQNLLRFAYHDGLISEVCPLEVETAWVLNIKKGILSAFQNTMLRFDVDFNTTETDVSGECQVQYALDATDSVFVTIKKTKDIGTCRHRYATQSVLQTTPYTFRDDKTIWPILNSQSYCNLTVDNSVYKEISCLETHLLLPFSNASSGALTTSQSKLELKGEESYSISEFLEQNTEMIERRATLIFDHTPPVKPTHDEIKAARELLVQMCASGFPNIQREFIDVFTNFLQTSKSLNYKTLSTLLQRSASTCDQGRNHVLESLPYIGSTASYQVMRDQIVTEKLTKEMAYSWMTSLSFITRPDDETLETFYTILEYAKNKLDPEYTLGATAVVHSYCKHHENCEENLKVQQIVNLLETEFLSLYQKYRGERKQRERLIVLLKGLGNIGAISEKFAQHLQGIIKDNVKTPVEIRLQAVLAFRRVDCLKYRNYFLDSYGDYTLNSELRIYSYLQTMRCPDYISMATIKSILEHEEINQVGSYVWSHLSNLARSNSPVRIEAQGLLLNDELSEKFKLDIRKFSRNYEHSLFFDEYNFGTTTDANLIFGTDSYLPRIASVNFTADLFGQSVNFFEFSARAEGFEELVSQAFGPKGPFNGEILRKKLSFLNRWLGNESAEEDDTLENLLNLDNLRLKRKAQQGSTAAGVEEDIDDDADYNFEESLSGAKRSKRDAPPASGRQQSIENNVDKLGYKLKYDYNNPKAQFGLRVFGNDLRFYSVESMLEVMALAQEFNPFHQAQKVLSGKEFTYTKSRVFLDAAYSVPLAVGLPLAIHAFGASSVDLRISGNLEQVDPVTDWHFDVQGRFKPSVSIDVITTMQTDMFWGQSGIKVKSNLYSNSEVEAKLKVRGRNLVSFSFNLPQDKNEIFSARSELLVIRRDEELPQPGIEKRSSNSTCTWPVLDRAIGLQMCSHYSVPDLSNATTIYPSLLLSGPLNFSLILKKSDLTAKKYAFEYKWDQLETDNQFSLVFTTPGSKVPRVLLANVTSVPNAFNASVAFVNGASRASAGCSYDGNPDYRRLDVYLDTNGNRSLDLGMELRRYQDFTAWIYKPRMLLAVNGINITGLVGSIKINEKNGIKQHDVELSFETRKLQAMVSGNVVQSEVTTSTNMTINYRFQANKIETINFAGRLVNNGDRSKTEYRGNMKLRTSAYPKLNFASNATWLSLQGHTEGMITYNNAPDYTNPNYTSLIRLIFARSQSENMAEASKTRASLELKLPRSKIDYRILVKHEERNKNGTEHNVIVGLKYAPEKEVTGLFSVHLPRRQLFAIDAYMNVTVPDFNSCTASIKVNEKAVKDYIIYINGSWFTGHSIAIKGNYKDRSSRVQALHHLKMIVESPSFETTSLNIVYRRNQLLIFYDLQAKYGKDPYGVTIQYAANDHNRNSNAEVRFKVKERDYWITAKVLSEQPKLLQLELHVDKIRDVHIKLGLLNIETRKELSLELKWDANRDPTQRLGLLIEYNNPGTKHYDGNVMLTYPERTINCGFNTYTGGPKYYGKAHASWSITEVIEFTYDAGIMPGEHLHNWIHAELSTPFEGWQTNSLRAGVYNMDNLILINSTLFWADDQTLELGYKSDYDIRDQLVSFDIRFGINSTIKDIPTINIKAKHWQDNSKIDTDLYLRYSGQNETINTYNILSKWQFLRNQRYKNVSGTMQLISPFEGYRKGGLAAEFMLNDQRQVSGAAQLGFDIRQFTLTMDGYVKKFTDNMLTINITTPLEKFRTINVRFGLNEKKRHAVAEVRAPPAALGAEALADIKNLLDFDVKLSVATPIENFHQAALFAKFNSERVDMRGLWNNSTLGFTGVWRMHNITDFEYSYLVFTPLAGFEENGFIVQLLHRDNFIFRLHGKLSQYKLGAKINGHPMSKLMNQLGKSKLKLETFYDDDFNPSIAEDIDEIEATENYFAYHVDFEVDSLVWPTIVGEGEIEEIVDLYQTVGHIQLPQGRIEFKDRLHYPDYINVLNVLSVSTPFNVAKDLKSIFEYHVDLQFNSFYQRIEFEVHDALDKLQEMGFQLNYTKVVDNVKPKAHNVQLKLITPYELLREIDINGRLELDDVAYKGNITSITSHTHLSLAAAVENEDNFLETSVGILLETDVIPHYACQVYFKKDFSAVDNLIDIRFEVTDNGTLNKLHIETDWHTNPAYFINANGKVHTTMLPLQLASTSILVTKGQSPQLNFDLNFLSRNGQSIAYGTRASKKQDVFNVEIWTPMKNYRNISMHGTLTRNSRDAQRYDVVGNLYRNMATYGITGAVRMADTLPIDVTLRVQPKTGGRDGVIELNINEAGAKKIRFSFSAIEDGKMCQISGGYSVSETNGAMDFSVLVESTEPEIARINFYGNLKPVEQGRIIGDINLQTPWKELGIETVHLHSDVGVRNDSGKIIGEYKIGKHIGRGSCLWSWILNENLQLVLESYMERPNAKPRIVHASAKYLNPGKSFLQLESGGRLSVDSKWNLDVNGSLQFKSQDDFAFGVLTQLPLPVGDHHQLSALYRGNIISKQFKDPNLFVEGSYEALQAKRKLLTRLSYRNATNDLLGLAHVEWGQIQNLSIVEGDFELQRKQGVRREFHAKLITPQFKDEHTFALTGHYDMANADYHNLVCALAYPASRRISDLDVSFSSLTNMHGVFNSTTPFLNVTWFKTDFEFTTKSGRSYRYCRCHWPKDSAYFKLQSTYDSDKNNVNHNLNGNVEIEVPLTTRHRADIVYGLQKRQNLDSGNVKVVYNEQQILDGKYKRVEQQRHPIYKDTTDITLENDMKPLGIHYVNTRDVRDPSGLRDIKHIEVYELRNTKNFNLTGELHTRATIKAQEFKVVAIHPNRAVVLTTKYEDVSSQVVRQHTKLELSETAWIGYNLELGNFSKFGNESQSFALEIFYPKRNLSTSGAYYVTDNHFNSDLAFKWAGEDYYEQPKAIRSKLQWTAEPLARGDRDHQTFALTVSHPYLEKDIDCKATYYRGLVDLLRTHLTINYSNEPDQLIVLGAQLKDLYHQLGHTNYTFKFYGQHEASQLDVQLNGTLAARPSYYKTESTAHYKRDIFPARYGKFLALLDMNKKELEYERQSPFHTVRLWLLPTMKYPLYGLNATVWDTPDTNHSGYVYVDLAERYARMDFNLTEDATQNLQMVGYIPDTRSGYLDVWRNYEEIRIIDVSSYLKMNHSRLITGRFHWRPTIKSELKQKISGVGNSIYNSFSDGIDFWIKSVYTESVESVGVVWSTAKEYNKQFIDDIGQLSVLDEDLEDLRLFVNQSYEANDFYIKDVVNFTLTILDELAIRDHIESLPKIFSELWQAMGDSGKALRNSIVWLIETIKTTYNNLLVAVSRFFHGESLTYISTLMEKGIEKYDKFVKELHIKFIKYIENLWHKTWTLAENHWKNVLKRFEPHMFKFISFVETTAWDLSKEVFDFIYKRTNELAESPYFNKVSSFTADAERLYRDFKANDAITNIKKYSTLAWNFVKEKYFKLVPFGAELNEVLTEIWQELKELEKIEQVQLMVQKYYEILARLDWIADELQLEHRLHQIYGLLRNKFRNYAMNALETADMYREAKTKFVFDPEVGIIDLEQKLPMSWHAFNETPKFEEIPEYKVLSKVQSFLSETNSSIIMKLYNMRAHLDPKTWLPPYYSRALLIDSRHYMTFDQRFVGLNLNYEEITNGRRNPQCSYLLAHDFFRRNFTLLLEPGAQPQAGRVKEDFSTRKLSFIANGQLIEIDLGTDHISINGNPQPVLPLKLDAVTIYRELDVLSITSDTQFSLHCNVQFDLCWFEVSGWYFAKTAGLLGTLNNEPFDEYTMSNSLITNQTEEFTDSWSLQHCKQTQTAKRQEISKEVHELCHSFFRTGILSACTAVLDPAPFYEMCLDLGMKSQPIRKDHPAVKGACAAALAYIETCTAMKVPMRVPTQCVFCQLSNGSYVPEGTFMDLTGADIPQSSDVVFIVEAKDCNANLKESKNILSVVSSIEEQLQAAKLTNNRYAVVAFGGASPYEKQRTIIYERNVFTSKPELLVNYFDHISTGNNGSSDITQAIHAAAQLNFRPGVSKTFILLSCSSCAAKDMRYDYTSILQYMQEEGVNLHILADTEFDFERTRKLRHFFGLDRELVYSKRFPEGDAETRKQVHIPKSNLGICTPLALETGGSVFSARKLAPERKYPIKRFATIFAKRVAQSATPSSTQRCECSAYNTGVAYVSCSPRSLPEENGSLDEYDDFNDWEWDDEELDDEA